MTWSEEKLGDFIRIKHGYAFKGQHFVDESQYQVLTPGNVHPKGGLKLNPGKDTFYAGPIPDDFIFERGDLFVVMTDLTQTAAILGGAAFIPDADRYLHNQRLGKVSVINPKRLNRRFLAYYLNWQYFRDQVKASSNGATVKHTSPSRIYNCKILLPDLAVQQKIAAILTAYDDLIENNRQRIALLEKMAEEIYREWFVRLRFPGHEHTPVHKGVPEGWDQRPSSEILHVMSGGTPKTDNASYWGGEIPFFTPKDATSNFYVKHTEKVISETGLESCNSALYPANTIFITARGTVGKIALAQRPMAMNQSCYALAPMTGEDSHYYFLALRGAVSVIRGIAKSGVFSNIIVDTFKQIPLFEPSEDIRKRFANVIDPIFEELALLGDQVELLGKTRDLLLNRLISGKLRVDDLDIQFPPSMKEKAA